MNYLKDLKIPFLLGAAIFAISFLTFWRLNFYAIGLAILYFVLGSISNAGVHYLDLTQAKASSQKLLKFLLDPLAVFTLITGICYAYSGEFHWIFVGAAFFISLILFVVTAFDWTDARAKENATK